MGMATHVTPCFKCGHVPESVNKEHFPEQPYGATIFTTGGHYGSTVYDPMSQYRRLRIIICDNCLRQYKAQVREQIETPRSSKWEYCEWNPFEEGDEEDADVRLEPDRPQD